MKRLIGLALLALSFQLSAQHTLKVDITKIEDVKGELELCLYGEGDRFMYAASACDYIAVDANKVSYEFRDLPVGSYAVVVYQDLNGNRDLDTNWMKIPKEPYGFSNNPSTTFGPPSFEKASFMVSKDHNIEVRLN